MFNVTLYTSYVQYKGTDEQRTIKSAETIGVFPDEVMAANFGNLWAYAWELKNNKRDEAQAMYKTKVVA